MQVVVTLLKGGNWIRWEQKMGNGDEGIWWLGQVGWLVERKGGWMV